MTSSSSSSSELKIAVIGAGVAGVATVAALNARGIRNVKAFDKQLRPGGLWCNNYPGAKNQTGAELYEFPDKMFPKDIPRNSRMVTAAEVCAYLEDFIDEQGIGKCFNFGVEIDNVTRKADNEWILHFKDNTQEMFNCVIVCSGLYSAKPNIVHLDGQDAFEEAGGMVLHTSELKTDSTFAGKNVVVVGNGKSAMDAARRAGQVAQETSAAPTVQLVRHAQWYFPTYLLGLIHIKYAMFTRFGAAMLPRYYFDDSFLSKVIHWILTPYKLLHWRLVELLFVSQYRVPRHMIPKLGTLVDEAFAATALAVEDADLIPYRTGQVIQRVATVERLEPGKVVLSTGDVMDADVIVLGTGWTTGLEHLDKETVKPLLDLDDDGLWLYRHILPPKSRGLAFVGYGSTFSNPNTSYIQACWLADLIAGIREWPSEEDMVDNTEREKQFKRALYPRGSQRGASIYAYLQHYHDLLVRDMNVDPMRYGGGMMLGTFCNWMLPVVPSDLRGVLLDPNTRHSTPKLRPPAALYLAVAFVAASLIYRILQ